MNKFTPGPWIADGRDVSPESNLELSVCTVMPIDIGGEKGWHEGKETQANASLIAAAPDLLEALIYARRFLFKDHHYTAFVDVAIARARGESQ